MEENKLTYLQKVALDGDIAHILHISPHNEDLKYRIYMILKELDPEYRDYIIQAVRDITKFPEGELERVLWEV